MMLKKAARVDFLLTATEREALILERNLIKEYRPRFNVMLRDDKNYLCLPAEPERGIPDSALRAALPRGRGPVFRALFFSKHGPGDLKVMKRAFKLRTCRRAAWRPAPGPVSSTSWNNA